METSGSSLKASELNPYTLEDSHPSHTEVEIGYGSTQQENIAKLVQAARKPVQSQFSRHRLQEKLQPSTPEFAQYLKKIKSLSSTSYPVYQRSSSAVRVPPRSSSAAENAEDLYMHHGKSSGTYDGMGGDHSSCNGVQNHTPMPAEIQVSYVLNISRHSV